MIDDDERLDELTTAVAHATHAAAEANIIRQQGIETFLIGAGVCLALLGGGFFIAAKGHVVEVPAEGAAIREAPDRHPEAAHAPLTLGLTEQEFMSRPEFKTAEYQGRLVVGSNGLKFDTGASTFALAKYDAVSGRMVPDRDATLNAARFVSDLAFCRSIPGSDLLKCWALHQGIVVDLDQSESVKP